MKTQLKLFLMMFPIIGGCSKVVQEPVMCTQEFAIVAVEIEGGTLDSWQTIRKKNGKVIDLPDTFNNHYPVLDDSFQSELEGKTEKFVFQGFIDNRLVVNEEFQISADQCHIRYEGGRLKVDI